MAPGLAPIGSAAGSTFQHSMGRRTPTRLGAVCAAILAAIAMAGLAAVPASAKTPSKEQLKTQLTKQLRAQGLTPRRLLPCRERAAGSRFRCEWRATGTYTNGPGYRCGGRATYTVKGKVWRTGRCLNAELWDLLLERGVQPKAILNAKRIAGGVRYEWRAEGVWPGEVPYRCKNVARYSEREWRLGACENDFGAIEPLAATPGPHPAFGFNEDWTNPEALGQLDRAVAIGADAARFNVSWESVERTRDAYWWDTYDRTIDTLLAEGVRPILILASAPCWAQDDPSRCSPVGSPREGAIGEYAELAALVAERYPQALAIEVWNEPNWTPFWAPLPDPARYARMVRAVADAVHATGTGVPVVVAGNAPLAGSSEGGRKIAFDEFLRRVYEAGGIGRAAAVAHHVYFGDVKDFALTMRQQIARLRGIMAAHGDGSMPILITELGISSDEETGLQGQGTLLAELYATLRRIQNVPLVLVHRLIEAYDPLSGGVDRRGVLDAHGNQKPAYCALGNARGSPAAGC